MKTKIIVLTAVSGALFCAGAQGADWPQWRGPNRDAVVSDPAHALAALPAAPKALWKLDVGEGLASPVVAGNKLVYVDSQGGNETAHCVDAATGKVLWTAVAGPLAGFSPSAYGFGPRCTPFIDGDRIYTQTGGGEFRCLSMADGKVLWQKSFAKDYGVTFLANKSGDPEANETASRRHGNNGSGVVDGNRVFVPVGSVKGATLVCFDKMTGKEFWRAGNDNTAYSSVMVATLAGTRQAVHFTADALMGVDVASGKILWRVPLKTGAKRHVCTPVISGDTVIVASTSIGTIQFKIVKAGAEFKAEKVWENLRCKTIIGSPTLVGKHLFTLGPEKKAPLVCLDAATGNQLWTNPGLADYASITAVNDKLLVLNQTGELYLVKASPEKYEQLGKAKVCETTYCHPAYADGKLYVKDAKQLVAYQLAP